MKCCDVIAYVYDGEIYCEDCVQFGIDDTPHHYDPVFAEYEESIVGSTCGGCQSWYSPDDGWTETDPKYYRWASCEKCGHQEPFARDNREARMLTRFGHEMRDGRLRCRNCLDYLAF